MNISAQVSRGQPVVVMRVCEATPDELFDAWTHPETLNIWWGPEGFTTTVEHLDFRVGGGFKIKMISPTGAEGATAGIYREIDRPNRLVIEMTEHCNCDLNGIAPQTARGLVSVQFDDMGQGRTEIVLTHEGLTSPELAIRHEIGWNGSLGKLSAVPEKIHAG